jgi:predicted HNH restriction endonuclease
MLDVHHIQSISTDWDARLMNTNLITLCRTCHWDADHAIINGNKLRQIAIRNEAVLSQFS